MIHEPIALAVPSAPATCADTHIASAIDVVALSVGRPDGRYYAGMRTNEWMSFSDRLLLSDLEHYAESSKRRHQFEVLKARRSEESLVVRWDIDGGEASAPTPLWDMRVLPRIDGRRAEDLRYSFVWGAGGSSHVDCHKLGWKLIDDALSPAQRDRHAGAYHKALMKILFTAADAWVIPAKRILEIAAEVDLRQAALVYWDRRAAASRLGLDIAPLLAAVEADAMKAAGGL